jgi:hypothetical protein
MIDTTKSESFFVLTMRVKKLNIRLLRKQKIKKIFNL